jgi:hypothetical protein
MEVAYMRREPVVALAVKGSTGPRELDQGEQAGLLPWSVVQGMAMVVSPDVPRNVGNLTGLAHDLVLSFTWGEETPRSPFG